MREDIKISIMIPPVTKKNSQQILTNSKTGRKFIAPSKAYQTYEKTAGWFIKGFLRNLKIDTPVNVKCVYFMPTKRRVDLVNLQEATLDVLVKYGVLADDSCNIVYSMDGSRVTYSKDSPRTEVTISFYGSSSQSTGCDMKL